MSNTEESPFEGIEEANVILAFGAKWCGPWGLLQPTLDEIIKSGVDLRKVDVDAYPALSTRYAVVSLPTFIALRKGKEVRRRLGAVSPKDLWDLSKALS